MGSSAIRSNRITDAIQRDKSIPCLCPNWNE
jgi:hypothetical protein